MKRKRKPAAPARTLQFVRHSGGNIEAREVNEATASEMARVGILPSLKPREPGHVLMIAGQPFVIIGPATRAEFLAAVEAAGLPVEAFSTVPEHFHFLGVSTD